MQHVNRLGELRHVDQSVRAAFPHPKLLHADADGRHWLPVLGFQAVLHSRQLPTYPLAGHRSEALDRLPAVTNPSDALHGIILELIYESRLGLARNATDKKKAGSHYSAWLSGLYRTTSDCLLVPTERLELSRLAPPPPQDGVSTNSTTSA